MVKLFRLFDRFAAFQTVARSSPGRSSKFESKTDLVNFALEYSTRTGRFWRTVFNWFSNLRLSSGLFTFRILEFRTLQSSRHSEQFNLELCSSALQLQVSSIKCRKPRRPRNSLDESLGLFGYPSLGTLEKCPSFCVFGQTVRKRIPFERISDKAQKKIRKVYRFCKINGFCLEQL